MTARPLSAVLTARADESGDNHGYPPPIDGRFDAEASALYFSVFQQSPDPMLIATLEGHYVDANAAALTLLGYTKEELPRLDVRDVVISGPGWTPDAYARFLAKGSWQGEVNVCTKTGQIVPTDVRTVVLSGDGHGLHVSFFRDLSARMELERTRARLAALVESTADAVIGATPDGRIVDWNPAAERIFGYSAPEALGQSLFLLIPPESAREVREQLAGAEQGESAEDVESIWLTKNGQRIDVAVTVSPVYNDAKQVVGTSSIVRDISRHKSFEAALAAGERRFRVAFEDAPIGMVLTALDSTPVQVNRAICNFLGFTKDELLATTLRARTHPDDRDVNQELVNRMLAGQLDRFELEKRYVRKDGRIVWAHLSVSLARDEAGSPLYFLSHVQDITDRKMSEAELTATHLHTSEVLERVTDGFCAVDPEWRFTYVNHAAEQIMWRTRQELLGKSLWKEFPHLVDSPVYDLYHQAVADGTTIDFEHMSPRDFAWYNIRAYPSPNGLSIFYRNVTESRRFAQELRASEEKYRSLVEQLPAVVYLQGPIGADTVTYCSPYIAKLTGYQPEELLAILHEGSWLETLHPDDRPRIEALDHCRSARGEPFSLEYRIRRKDGSFVWVRDECMPIRDHSGTIVAWQGVLLDITDRLRAEETQARLAAIVEGAEDAIYSRTPDGTITSWNRGAERLYGYSAEEAIGRSFLTLVPEDLSETVFTRAKLFGTEPSQFEATRRRKDGSLVDVSISLSPIRDSVGNVVGVSTITRDITERKQAEEDLRAALEAAEAGVRVKTLFLAMMSHELRTPLQAVLGYADFLLHGPPGSLTPEQAEDIGYIHQGAGRMVALIEQMLDLSRLEAGRLEIASEPVDLTKILEQVRQDVVPQVAAKPLVFSIEVPQALPFVLGDPIRLRQILLNLVGNAVKFTDAGSVRVNATATDHWVEVNVTDTGIGIAPDDLPHIFEEFRQVNSTTTRRHGGAGLGLAIAKRLAEQMGGQITVQSTPGAGSSFSLRLLAGPARRSKARRQAARTAQH
jgi:PAS domain S-box-containing protein